MKILIQTGGWGSRHIVLDASHAALAAGLLAHAALYEDDGSTSDGKCFKLSKDGGLTIQYAEDRAFEELPQAIIDARKEASDANSARYAEQSKNRDLQKELAEVKTALAAIQSVTVCTQTEPAPTADDDLSFLDAEEQEES